jgi:hypothetical protein
MSKVYLVAGVSGAGKSWVCEQLSHLAIYRPVDKVGHIDPTQDIEIHDRTVKVSTTIKKYEQMGIEVYPVFVMGDFLQVKQQLVNRGGKVTKNIYKRWKRMERLAEKYSKFTGSSQEVLKHLRSLLTGTPTPSQPPPSFDNDRGKKQRIFSLKKRYTDPKLRERISSRSKSKWADPTYHRLTTVSIKESRSSESSREKTKRQMRKQRVNGAWLAKMREVNREINARSEVKAKLSEARKDRNARSFVAERDGVVVGEYTNQCDAAKELGLNACSISQVLRGKAKRTGGYTFRYTENPSALDEEYLASNNDRARVYQNERKKNDPLFKLACLVRSTVYRAIKQKTRRTHHLLGCSYETLMDHLGDKPTMDAHLDHVCPISQATSTIEAEALCHYTNLRWLPAEANLAKSDSWTPEGEEICRKLLGREWIH